MQFLGKVQVCHKKSLVKLNQQKDGKARVKERKRLLRIRAQLTQCTHGCIYKGYLFLKICLPSLLHTFYQQKKLTIQKIFVVDERFQLSTCCLVTSLQRNIPQQQKLLSTCLVVQDWKKSLEQYIQYIQKILPGMTT